MDAFRLLDRSTAVLSFDVIDHRVWHAGSYLRVKALLRDGSELHVREFVDEADRKYSFHWQSGSGVLLARWDNAPHHPGLPTYPDHKHVPTGVEATIEVALADVLASIERSLRASL
jgi:hypothetical protein